MKDWQFFCLLATIYAAPYINRYWAGAMSAVFTGVSLVAYYWGGNQ